MQEKLISWNVNGVRSCAEKGLLDFLKEASPDVLCLQETKAHEGQLDKTITHIDGYTSYWTSAKKKGYSGTATYCRRKPISVEILGIDEFDDEGRVQIITFPEYTLINCYFPNSQDAGARLPYKLGFCNALFGKCEELRSEGKRVLLCGDYNIAHKPIDLTHPKPNEGNPGYLPEERAWMDSFTNAGYVDIFRRLHPEPNQYSWWSYRAGARSRNVGWRIDYFCISPNAEGDIKEAFRRPDVMGSDHCPVGIVLDVP